MAKVNKILKRDFFKRLPDVEIDCDQDYYYTYQDYVSVGLV